jgi:fused signal recognition particle receptor
MSFFDKLKNGLTKTRENFTGRIEELVGLSASIDDDFLEELEMIMLSGDVGVKTTEMLIDAVRQAAKKREIKGTDEVLPFLKKKVSALLKDEGQRTRIGAKPTVILVVGVNGVGKTTTIGKLANYFHLFNYKVMLCAGDTFRAAASEQLKIWGQRAQCEVIAHEEGADPAAVVYDAMKAAMARKVDVLFIDTAGRLHNKSNLMNELEKINRIIKREMPEAPHEVFLVLDATTGQNAIAQAKAFTEVTKLTGVVLTKLDGTAKGGVVIAIKEELGLPVKWIGVGEGLMDFRPFEPDKFVEALFAGQEEEAGNGSGDEAEDRGPDPVG